MKKGERKRKKKKERERSEHITKDTEREGDREEGTPLPVRPFTS